MKRRGASDKGIRCGCDRHVRRVEQPQASLAHRGRCINQPTGVKQLVARGFDKTAVAAVGTTARGNQPEKRAVIFGPNNDLAAVAAGDRISTKFSITPDECSARIRQQLATAENESALLVAAGENVAATGRPRRIDTRAVENAGHVADHRDLTTNTGIAFGFDGACRAGGAARGDRDAAAARAVGRHATAGGERGVDEGFEADGAAGAGIAVRFNRAGNIRVGTGIDFDNAGFCAAGRDAAAGHRCNIAR